MSELFLHFLNSGIAAGWLVLLVLVARLLLKKAPKWVVPALWGIVALRLILPFSVESALSLIPSAETVSPEVVHYDPRPTITSGVAVIDDAVNPVLSETFAAEAGMSVNPLDAWTNLAGAVWLLGAAAMLGYALCSWLRLRRRVGTAVRLEGNVYQSENAPSPFILGVLRPRIYIPFTLQGTALSCVLAHERAHLARRDHWWKPLGYVLLSLYWFHPLLWVAYILLCRDIELACDERVIRTATSEQRADYSQALLVCSAAHRRRITACPLAFGEVGVKARVKRVLSYKKPAFYLVLAAVAVCIVLAVCGLTDPKTEDDDNTPYRWMSSVAVEDIDRAALSSGEELTDTQLAALVNALHAVKKDELYGDGRGTPHTARVTLTCGEAEYTLSAGGGITEFSCSDKTLFDAPTGPVWEVHNETLAELIVMQDAKLIDETVDLNGDGKSDYIYRSRYNSEIFVLDSEKNELWSGTYNGKEYYFLDTQNGALLYYVWIPQFGKYRGSYEYFDFVGGEKRILAQNSITCEENTSEWTLAARAFADEINTILAHCDALAGWDFDTLYMSDEGYRVYPLGYTPPTGNAAFDALILAVEQSRAEAANGGEFDTERFSGALMPSNDSFQTVGWTLYDIDGDGQEELLFGENGDDGWDSIVYHIYASDGTPVVYGWERSRYTLCGDGMVMHEGSGGAFEYSTTIYRYQNGALVPIETVYFHEDTWYHGEGKRDSDFYVQQSSGEYVVSPDFTPIGEDRAEEILGIYSKLSLTFTPFD